MGTENHGSLRGACHGPKGESRVALLKGDSVFHFGTAMMRTIIVAMLLMLPQWVLAVPLVIEKVPSYRWYHGCSPTAAANIMGYWDLNGYGNLFDAQGWHNVRLTDKVKDHISSPAHNAKFDPFPDDSTLPDPPDTSIADFMHTSEGVLSYGGTWVTNIDDGLRDYPAYRGYRFSSQYVPLSWEAFVDEIASGMPVLLNVDSGGDGRVDHSITGIGYEDRGVDGLWYASYNTWHESETIDWYQWRSPSSDYRFGVYSMVSVHPLDRPDKINSVPEPPTILLLGIGLLGIANYRFRK